MKRCVLLLLCFLLSVKVSGQYERTNSLDGFYSGEGAVTTDEVRGYSGPLSGYMSFPYTISGAFFVSYRKHISPMSVVGGTIGLDNQAGDLSYGNPMSSLYGTHFDGYSGKYKRQAYTIAAEYCLVYTDNEYLQIYGCAGVAFTYCAINYSFFKDIYYPEYFYGPAGLVPSNPYNQHYEHFNMQVSPFGIRAGNTLAYYLEIGVGYKGLIHMGIAYRL